MVKITTSDALEMLSEIFEEPIENISPELSRDDVSQWDSLGTLALMAELDDRFGIILTPDESRGMARIDDVLQLLKRHGVLAD
ncbi:acyl carrier protein [Thiocapsa marina]|uniref:Putative acyl carrier protein n=1 Tax=Thiocapsa marina 5811 TaxID=768671 RepID=F9UAU0_9GAMM|nr:acyl carrier protein [Thiocapsa marina]EGV18558.1 putative acyl carrier protein [Thiocapsa marina 5811]